MPRSGIVGTYTLPPGTIPQQPNTTIESADWNSFAGDVQQAFNTPTPTAYGGTGASDIGAARTNLGALGVVRQQTFTASGTYTPHANMLYVQVESIGGGGAGGGVIGAASSGASGGGGGAGGYTVSFLARASVASPQTVTIGAGGAPVSGGTGGNGGATSFGLLNSANGGNGGIAGNATSTSLGAGGNGATAASLGNRLYGGAPGQNGYASAPGVVVAIGGPNGGDSVLGGAGKGGYNSAGSAGTAPGAGGGGVASYDNPGNRIGGAGASGLVIVTEFCSE